MHINLCVVYSRVNIFQWGEKVSFVLGSKNDIKIHFLLLNIVSITSIICTTKQSGWHLMDFVLSGRAGRVTAEDLPLYSCFFTFSSMFDSPCFICYDTPSAIKLPLLVEVGNVNIWYWFTLIEKTSYGRKKKIIHFLAYLNFLNFHATNGNNY